MSFLTPIFLFATAAAAIPVVLHLVRQIKAKPVPFSSLMFIPATPREAVRRRKLKDRLLMAMRALMLVLLALVFARPFMPQEQLPFVPERQAESVVVLLDRSLSMRYDGAFSRAVDAVGERLGAARVGDEAALIAFGARADLLAPLSTDPTALRAALTGIEPGYGATDFLPALQRAVDVLAEARHARRVVVLASDFQASAWERAPADWKLPGGIIFEPLFVGSSEASNGYVDAFEQKARRTGNRTVVRYDARVAVSGADPDRPYLGASLLIENAAVERTSVPVRRSAPISFEAPVPRPGYFQGMIALEEDGLPEDDRRYFTHRSQAPPTVLVVDAPSAAGRRDAFYLRTAFDLGEASRFRFAHEQRVSQAVLRGADVAFISSPDAPSDIIRRFVEQGGTVVLSPHDGVTAARFSGLLSELELGTAAEVVDVREAHGYEAIIAEADTRHPVFASLSTGSALLRPRFRRFVRVRPASGTVVLARFDSGDPFLLERRLGSGRILVCTSTLGTAWTDLPLDELFVPLVYQLATYGTRQTQDDLSYYVDDVVPLHGNPRERWEVRTPAGELFRVTLDDEGRGVFRETHVPGHYAAASGGASRLFSVNVDPTESDLTPRDPEEVYAAITAPGGPVELEGQAAAAGVDHEANQKLWRILLLLVLALFALESWLANRERKEANVAQMDLPRAA